MGSKSVSTSSKAKKSIAPAKTTSHKETMITHLLLLIDKNAETVSMLYGI